MDKRINWTADELRLAILRVVHSARNDDNFIGATPYMIMEIGADVKEVELSLAWLAAQDFIFVSKRRFLITTKGIDFLGSDGAPPEDWARVPRRPAPTGGEAGISLNLPEFRPECDE
jgi:hypothetical protein